MSGISKKERTMDKNSETFNSKNIPRYDKQCIFRILRDFRESVGHSRSAAGYDLTVDRYSFELGNSIRTFREMVELSQSDIALLLDLSQPTISLIEAGRSDIRARDLFTLCLFSRSDYSMQMLKRKNIRCNSMEPIYRYLKSIIGEDGLLGLAEDIRNMFSSPGSETGYSI